MRALMRFSVQRKQPDVQDSCLRLVHDETVAIAGTACVCVCECARARLCVLCMRLHVFRVCVLLTCGGA